MSNEEEQQVKILKGDLIKNIVTNTLPEVVTSNRTSPVVSADFNQKRESASYRNYGLTFSVRNAHSDRINCICYLAHGTFMTGSSDKLLRIWAPLDNKPLGTLQEDFSINHMIRIGKT